MVQDNFQETRKLSKSCLLMHELSKMEDTFLNKPLSRVIPVVKNHPSYQGISIISARKLKTSLLTHESSNFTQNG
jgi:hypothetical protein